MRSGGVPTVAAALVLVSLASAPSPARAGFIRGDVTQDGRVDITDPVQVLFFLFRGEDAPACYAAADADDSGRIDLNDAVGLLAFLFQGGAAPPAPWPSCGDDPTADFLTCASFPSCDPPPVCDNVVARAAERGCGRIFIWGDEHIKFDEYWPAIEPFWTNVAAWLLEVSCGRERLRVGFEGVEVQSPLGSFLLGLGLAVDRLLSSDLDSYDVVIMNINGGSGLEGDRMKAWVEEGGAFMAFGGLSGEHRPEDCDSSNELVAPLGFTFDCWRRAPGGPIETFEDHPIAAGLSPGDAPFVGGIWIDAVPDMPSDVVARAAPCHPAAVPDCRKVLEAFDAPDPDGGVPVDFECLTGGNSIHVANQPDSGLVELNIVVVRHPSGGDGGSVLVQVERPDPMVLVLVAYGTVVWTVEASGASDLRKVIVSGNDPQFLDAPFGVEQEVLEGPGVAFPDGYGTDCGGGDTPALIRAVVGATGLPLKSFHGCYEACSATIR